jgi:hypothetical protein
MEQSHSARPRVRWSLLAAAMAAACVLHGTARAGDGATPATTRPADSPYQLAPARSTASPVRALGSYYLFDPAQSTFGPTMTSLLGGLRLSTGVVGLGQPMSVLDNPHDSAQNLPYFGLGYSHLWFHSQLSLNADFGLASGSSVGFGRGHGLLGTLPSIEETSGDPRWAPVMAVNVRYSF